MQSGQTYHCVRQATCINKRLSNFIVQLLHVSYMLKLDWNDYSGLLLNMSITHLHVIQGSCMNITLLHMSAPPYK